MGTAALAAAVPPPDAVLPRSRARAGVAARVPDLAGAAGRRQSRTRRALPDICLRRGCRSCSGQRARQGSASGLLLASGLPVETSCEIEFASPASLPGGQQRSGLEECCLQGDKGDDKVQSDGKEGRADQQTTVESMSFSLQECALNPSELSANPSSLECSEETAVDPQIQAAIRKMKKLDTILAKKHLKERAVKSQGKEMRAKLWGEFQSIRSTGSHEEMKNTELFLALISLWQDTAGLSLSQKRNDHQLATLPQTSDQPSELETNEFLKEAGETHSKSENNQDFVKKNIELAKDSRNQIVLLEDGRKRLMELLKDTEEGTELQGLEESVSGWLAPGEGYTPDPKEFHQLKEIEMKLQVLLSDGDPPGLSSSYTNPPSQIYQESLAYADRSLEAAPGEKVLRDNKEQRDQQNHLKEIDLQLKFLERKLCSP